MSAVSRAAAWRASATREAASPRRAHREHGRRKAVAGGVAEEIHGIGQEETRLCSFVTDRNSFPPVYLSPRGGYAIDVAKAVLHKTHPHIINRLRRSEGHLRTIIAMLEEQRGCLDVAQQLHAVEKAIVAAKKVLIHDHIDHCLEQAVGSTSSKAASLDEFKEITKYL